MCGASGQGADDEHTAQSHHQQEQEEGQAGQQPLIMPGFSELVRLGHEDLNVLCPFRRDQEIDSANSFQWHQPNVCASHCCPALLLDVGELHCVNHHHVAEGTEADEEEDAAVQFEVDAE